MPREPAEFSLFLQPLPGLSANHSAVIGSEDVVEASRMSAVARLSVVVEPAGLLLSGAKANHVVVVVVDHHGDDDDEKD